MRFYNISIGSGETQNNFSSLVNGTNDPGALDIELNIFSFLYATTDGGGSDVRSYVRIYGIPQKMIAQANNLNGQPIKIYGGMSKGYPLAKPQQQGLLNQGNIYPAFGNWIGTETTLDLILSAPTGSQFLPKNIAQVWKKGTPLSSLIQSTLTQAFAAPSSSANPTQIDVNISPKLVLNYDVPVAYGTLQQFAIFILNVSRQINPIAGYRGVQIVQYGNKISAYDGTVAAPLTKQIAFEDLIGQPTWYGNTVNFKTVMRGDIGVGDIITMPPAVAVVTPLAATLSKNGVTFAGSYMIQRVHHIGRFRQADAASWVTVFDAVTDAPGLAQTLGGSSFNAIY